MTPYICRIALCFSLSLLFSFVAASAGAETADQLLSLTPPSVLDKSLTPPSGDKHDFMTVGKYLWPNPATPNGLPYIYQDGKTNPNWETYGDYQSLEKMGTAVRTLGEAYKRTHKEIYAQKAAELLRVWFLDPRTRMNPNLRYGNAVPGLHEGTGGGVMDTMIFNTMVGAVTTLEASPSWTSSEKQQLRTWFRQFLTWIMENDLGRAEARMPNNHGTWYDVEVVAIALYLDDKTLAKTILEQCKEKRIARMIEPDGSQPQEIKRTLSRGYTVFSIDSFCRLAAQGDAVGVDLWNYETTDGRSIHKALDYVLPYLEGKKTWPYPQNKPLTRSYLNTASSFFRQAAKVYGDPRYQEAAEIIQSEVKAMPTAGH
jgi:hypothetical protein